MGGSLDYHCFHAQQKILRFYMVMSCIFEWIHYGCKNT